MSRIEAIALIQKELRAEFDRPRREGLNTRLHAMDLSSEALASYNNIRSTRSAGFNKDHAEFIRVLSSITPTASNYSEALSLLDTGSATVIVLNKGIPAVLIGNSFNAIQRKVSYTSSSIPTNRSFGQVFRAPTLEEIKSSSSLSKAAGRLFLRYVNGHFYIHAIVKSEESGKYEPRVPSNYTSPVTKVYYKRTRVQSNLSSSQPDSTMEGAEILIVDGEVHLRQDVRTRLDIGHIQGNNNPELTTPLGQKLQDLYSSAELKQAQIPVAGRGKFNTLLKFIKKQQDDLVKLHGAVEFSFHNTSKQESGASGFIIVTAQDYAVNSKYAIEEAKIRRNIIQKLPFLLRSIPGSNTIVEDAVEIAKNKLIGALLGKSPKSIKPHQKVSGRVVSKRKEVSTNLTPVPSKVPRKEKVVKAAPIRSLTTGRFTSLVSLQNLINSNLAQRIKENMGDGNRRDVLNLRTGRLAESAKVERMSQSREGMITAFYTYMKNPYATFSEGGMQQSPRSRDPKLLISKSIREIAQAQVANRMRAVLI